MCLRMRVRVLNGLVIMLLGFLIGDRLVCAESSIQLSFLDNPKIQQDTIDRLVRAGCGSLALDAFSHLVVNQQNRLKSKPDSEESAVSNGTIRLGSSEQLSKLGNSNYCDVIHWRGLPNQHYLTCFDLALLILREGPVFADRASEGFASKHFRRIEIQSRGGMKRFHLSNMNDSGPWSGDELLSSRKTYEVRTQLPTRSVNESRLALSLRSARSIPGHYVNTQLALTELFEKKVDLWRRDGVVFSESIQIVLCHFVDLRGKFIGVDHIGLLVQKEEGWMYVEKNGSTSPIVRIDFSSVEQLLDFMSSLFEEERKDPRSPLHLTAFMVSINDQLHRVVLRNSSKEMAPDKGRQELRYENTLND